MDILLLGILLFIGGLGALEYAHSHGKVNKLDDDIKPTNKEPILASEKIKHFNDVMRDSQLLDFSEGDTSLLASWGKPNNKQYYDIARIPTQTTKKSDGSITKRNDDDYYSPYTVRNMMGSLIDNSSSNSYIESSNSSSSCSNSSSSSSSSDWTSSSSDCGSSSSSWSD